MQNEIQKIKLSEYAREQNVPYKKIWDSYANGTLTAKTEVSKTGRVFVLREMKASANKTDNLGKFATPTLAGMEETTASRRNKAGSSQPTDTYFHIESGVVPFQIGNGSNVSVTDAIKLTQKCYYNFSVLKNIIDLMTEFSCSKIYLRGGNAKSRKFVGNWLESIGYLAFQDMFYREFYRSCNVFIKRFEAKIKSDDVRKLSKAFELESLAKVTLPVRYIILNPADIAVEGALSFTSPTFLKILNNYELAKLRNPKTDEEKRFFSSLPLETQKQIKSGVNNVLLPLNPEDIYAIFNKKQDYEPLAIPMAYPVLKDINWKAEMKHIDMAVARVMNNVVLLVKMGYESKNGEYMFDQQAAEAMRALFESESVGKTLVADFTTELEHKIPQIGDFLDPKKYDIVNQDIREGLNSILIGGGDSKFANQFIQTQIFVQRLTQAREAFLNSFLIPEIKRICNIMSFRDYPEPVFEDIGLEDDSEFNRIVTRLAEIGVLTATETLTAIDNHRLPTKEESELAQEEYKRLRDKGYYEPITGGPQSQKELADKTGKQQIKMQESQFEHDSKQKTKELKHKAANPEPVAPQIHINAPGIKKPAGKPAGKAGPNSKTRKSKPMKASEDTYSLNKIKDNIIVAMQLRDIIYSKLKGKYGCDELSEEQKSTAEEIREVVLYSEPVDNWNNEEIIAGYIENPIIKDENALEVDEVAITHSVSPFLASILIASKREE